MQQLHRRLISLSFAVITLVIALSSMVYAATLSPSQNVSNDQFESTLPRLAQDPQGNIHVVWDSAEGGRKIRYAKGTWNGSSYTFGQSYVLADVGAYGYALPNIAVAPNGTVLAAWSNGTLNLQTWNSQNAAPSGTPTRLTSGIQPSIAADSQNRFHIVWNGDFKVQYCQWSGSGCTAQQTFPDNDPNRPDVAVDSNDAVHVVWFQGSNGVFYRSRPKDGAWSASQRLADGNFTQIAADGAGNVHIVWSANFDVLYCRKTLTSGCVDQKTINAGDDLQPSVGATRAGGVVVGFRDSGGGRLMYDARENGAWAGPKAISSGVMVDVMPRPYNDRTGLVWSEGFDIRFAAVSTSSTPPATPTPIPPAISGSLKINGGATITRQPTVSVAINNTSSTNATSYSLADDADPGTPNQPFSNPTTTNFNLNVADGRCRAHVVYGRIAGGGSVSNAFSGSIVYDPSAQADVQARNPNSPFNLALNAFGNTLVPGGDVAYTREQRFNLSVAPGSGECTGIVRYAIKRPGVAPTASDWKSMPADGYVSANISFIADQGQGEYRFDVYAEDGAGNVTATPYAAPIVYDTTPPSVSGADTLAAAPASAKGGFAQITLPTLTVSDNLYNNAGWSYWGYWMAVKRSDAGAPTAEEWDRDGVITPGPLASSLRWNMARGMVGGYQTFTPGQYTVYLRLLDGAGNASGTIPTTALQVNQLEFPIFLPVTRR